MVWPKSGCITSSATTVSSSSSEIALVGMSGRLDDSPNSQATKMTKAGLRNSDGWMLRPSSTSQRRAPLISTPKYGVAATMIRLTAKTTIASRRIWRGLRNDTASITAIAGMR